MATKVTPSVMAPLFTAMQSGGAHGSSGLAAANVRSAAQNEHMRAERVRGACVRSV